MTSPSRFIRTAGEMASLWVFTRQRQERLFPSTV